MSVVDVFWSVLFGCPEVIKKKTEPPEGRPQQTGGRNQTRPASDSDGVSIVGRRRNEQYDLLGTRDEDII